MNKINLSFILKSIIFVAITATTADQCDGKQCNKKVCGTKVKMLDPSLGLGTINCTDTGVYKKTCNHIDKYDIKCTLTPLEKQEDGRCYHILCSWETSHAPTLALNIPGPDYDTIHVYMYPALDIHPFYEFLLLTLIMSFLMCVACSMEGHIVEAFVVGSVMRGGGGGGGRSSSSGIG